MNTDTLPDILPQDFTAESIVLATVLHWPQDMGKVEPILNPQDFLNESNQAIFTAMVSLYRNRVTVEPEAVFRELTRAGDVERMNITRLSLYDLARDGSLHTGQPGHFAGRVREQSIRRRLWRQGEEMIREALDEQNDVQDVITHVGQRLATLTGSGAERTTVASIGEYAERVYDEYYGYGKEQKIVGLRTGWAGINGILRPFRPGQLIAISADTGIGKTCWAMNLAVDLARAKKRGLVFTYEMAGTELTLRAALMRMVYTQDQLDNIDREEDVDTILQDLHLHTQDLKNLPLRIDEDNANTPERIERAIQAEINRFGKLDFVIVDYIGMVPSDSRRKRYEELGEISRFFKELPKKYGFVMFVLCQLGTKRLAERSNRRPQLDDVYESGRIPQDCDLFLSIYWPGRYGVNELQKAGYDPQNALHHNTIEVQVLKSRHGVAAGQKPFTCQRFEPAHVRYHDLTDGEWRQLPERVRPQ